MKQCSNCGKRSDMKYELIEHGAAPEHNLCSIDCLTEYAWKLREAQPKLSKSRSL